MEINLNRASRDRTAATPSTGRRGDRSRPDALDAIDASRHDTQAGQKTGGKCEVALKWHVPASRDLGTAVI